MSRLSSLVPGRRVAGIVAVAALALGGCSSQSTPKEAEFGFAVDVPLITTNAASTVGASTHAEQLASRLYPPVFAHGPQGQTIPNNDLASGQLLPGPSVQVIYTINPEATFSDEEPVTCDDFYLSFIAATHEEHFQAYQPIMQQVEDLACEHGDKTFTVTFKPNFGSRWRQLFGPGTVLPSHIIARAAGMNEEELWRAIEEEDSSALDRIGEAWNDSFLLRNFDPELHASSGPMMISEVHDDGSVVLVPNPHYAGDVPSIREITVYPPTVNRAEKAKENALAVADLVNAKHVDWVDRQDPANPYEITREVGQLNEQLNLANAGVLATPEARRAFAACVDQQAIARISADYSGVDVPPIGTRLSPATSPSFNSTRDISDRNIGVNLDRTREELEGATIRIGYFAPDPRKQAIVANIAETCGKAGVNVVDVSSESFSIGDLSRTATNEWGGQQELSGSADAILLAVDVLDEYASVNAPAGNSAALRAAEERLWNEIPSIPLTAQPRTFVVDKAMGNVVPNTSRAGIGWNMSRWQYDGSSR